MRCLASRQPDAPRRAAGARRDCDLPRLPDVLGLQAPASPTRRGAFESALPTGRGEEPMLPLRRLKIPAVASTLLLVAGVAPTRAPAAASSCPLFSYFTTSPAPANDHEPTLVTLVGCYPYA